MMNWVICASILSLHEGTLLRAVLSILLSYCVGFGDSGGLENSPDGFLIETSSKSSEGTTNETSGPGMSPKAKSNIIMPPKGFRFGARNGAVYATASLPGCL